MGKHDSQISPVDEPTPKRQRISESSVPLVDPVEYRTVSTADEDHVATSSELQVADSGEDPFAQLWKIAGLKPGCRIFVRVCLLPMCL